MNPLIAIVGRANVGKSTLLNRLAGWRKAVVSDVPGTTRDRLSADIDWRGRRFTVIDTGGLDIATTGQLYENVSHQSKIAIEVCDAVLFVVDAVEGITHADEAVADIVRRSGKPAILAVNKADNQERKAAIADFYRLGISAITAISAYHNEGISELIDELTVLLNTTFTNGATEGEKDDSIRIAFVGRPNTGKSSLFNAIAGNERTIVSPLPGTTRDAIDTEILYSGRSLIFLDTAGIRRRGKTEAGIEYYSVIRAINAIRLSHIVMVVLTAEDPLTLQDKHICGLAYDSAKACALIVNKSDLLNSASEDLERIEAKIRSEMPFLTGCLIIFTSALSGENVMRIPKETLTLYEEFTKRVPDVEVSRCIFEAVGENMPPRKSGKRPAIIKAVQEKTAPPVFLIDTSAPDHIHFSYKRYLENNLRKRFGFSGVPVRIRFRKSPV